MHEQYTNRIPMLYLKYLSIDMAVRLRTLAATVTMAMKLLMVQYSDPKTQSL